MDNVFYVGKHTDISPKPTGIKGISESHHGVNNVWMKEKYVDYGTGNNAPTVYMLKNPDHIMQLEESSTGGQQK